MSASRAPVPWAALRAVLCVGGITLALVPACLADKDLGTVDNSCPSIDSFRLVSQVIERRCGTLDCHGDPGRSLRIYGRTGMRLPRTKDEYIAEIKPSASSASASSSAGAGGGGDDTTSSTSTGELTEEDKRYNEYVTGGTEPTTNDELEANRLSLCGLEPDLMSEVVLKRAEPDTLTLVRKPRLTEAHKGGRIWLADSPAGDKCLTSWITGDPDVIACNGELKRP